MYESFRRPSCVSPRMDRKPPSAILHTLLSLMICLCLACAARHETGASCPAFEMSAVADTQTDSSKSVTLNDTMTVLMSRTPLVATGDVTGAEDEPLPVHRVLGRVGDANRLEGAQSDVQDEIDPDSEFLGAWACIPKQQIIFLVTRPSRGDAVFLVWNYLFKLWTVRVVYSSVSATVNFRLDKAN